MASSAALDRQELRRNVRAVHEQHSQLFRAQAQFSSSGNAVSDSSAAPARAYPPPAPLTSGPAGAGNEKKRKKRAFSPAPRSGAPGSLGPAPPAELDTGCFELSHMGNGFAASVARCREYRAAPQLNASGLLDHTLIA